MSDEMKPDLPTTTEDETNTDLDVVPEDTAGNVLEVVTNFVSRLDPSTWLARNASKAFGKLCSAPKEWYDAYFEGKAAETRVESEGGVKIREEIIAQIVQGIKVDPEYARRAGHKFAEKIIGEQLNLDKISAIAANELNKEQSDNSVNQDTSELNEQQAAGSTNKDTNGSEEKVINDDWLNSFETEARSKSTEEMQLRFGRILAGEIEKPGSYSIRAIKILGELDQYTAALFKKLCSVCLVMEFPFTRHIAKMKDPIQSKGPSRRISDMRVLSLGGDPGQGDLDKYGLGFHELNVLNEYDLIISVYNSSFEYSLLVNDKDWSPILPFSHQAKEWILLSSSEQNENQGFKWSGVEFSQAGRELFQIVDIDPMSEYTEDLKKFFAEQNLIMTEA